MNKQVVMMSNSKTETTAGEKNMKSVSDDTQHQQETRILHKRKNQGGWTIPVLALTLVAAAGMFQTCGTPPPPPPPVNMSVLKPSLTPLPETKSSQEKGGVEISIAPVAYTVVESSKVTDQVTRESVEQETLLFGGGTYQTPVRYIKRTSTPEVLPKS
jgi:hypothetical protein